MKKSITGWSLPYTTTVDRIKNSGGWDYLNVRIFKEDKEIGSYTRNYSPLFDTFYPFEQNGKHYALYSSHYMYTRIMTLPDCVDIGGESPKEEEYKNHFCPTGYFIPKYYFEEEDRPVNSQFGLVSGCMWGDDSSWKIQYLDLSRVAEGILQRDDRFGYIELLDDQKLSDAVRHLHPHYITLSLQQTFNIQTGKPEV